MQHMHTAGVAAVNINGFEILYTTYRYNSKYFMNEVDLVPSLEKCIDKCSKKPGGERKLSLDNKG